MKVHVRILGIALLALGAGLITRSGSQAGGQDLVWKPFLPDAEATKLIDRAKGIISEEVSKPKSGKVAIRKSNKRIQIQAAMIAAYALSAKAGANRQELLTIADAALKLSKAATSDANPTQLKKMAADLQNGRANARVNLKSIKWTDYFEDNEDLMSPMKWKTKGGNGLPPALIANARLGGALNGIEEKIRWLASKTRPAQMKRNMKKEGPELTLMADLVAVIAQVNHAFVPEKKEGKKDPADWKQWSDDMRDEALQLAEAARKGNSDMVLKFSQKLNNTCVRCHNIYKTSD